MTDNDLTVGRIELGQPLPRIDGVHYARTRQPTSPRIELTAEDVARALGNPSPEVAAALEAMRVLHRSTLGFTDAEIELMADVAVAGARRVFNAEISPAALVREMLAAVARQRELAEV
jgi:hypothetical protein